MTEFLTSASSAWAREQSGTSGIAPADLRVLGAADAETCQMFESWSHEAYKGPGWHTTYYHGRGHYFWVTWREPRTDGGISLGRSPLRIWKDDFTRTFGYSP